MRVEVQFEPASAADFTELLSMMEEFYAIDGYPFNRSLVASNLQLFTASETFGKLWMIKNEQETAGYVILTFCFSFEFGGRTAFIDELFLKHHFRSKGIGNKVIDFVKEQAKELGLKALHLEVERHNEKGNRLYIKKGFKEHKRSLMTKMID